MDITDRLRRWTHAPDAMPASDLMDAAAAEIDRLRGHLEESEARASLLELAIRRLADQDATLSVCGGNVTVTMDATLTDAEREAVRFCGEFCRMGDRADLAATLRGLLERLPPIAACDNDARLAALDRLVAGDQKLETR